MDTQEMYERQLKMRLVDRSRTCDGVESTPFPLDIVRRGGVFIPGPNPVFSRNETMCRDAEFVTAQLISEPPFNILSVVDYEYHRKSCFTVDGASYRCSRYAVSSPQMELHTLVALTLELRLAVLFRCLTASDDEIQPEFEPTHVFTFDGTLPNPNEFIWPDGGDWPSDPFGIFRDDLVYVEHDWGAKTPYWCKLNYQPRLSCKHELRIDASQGSPITFHFKEDMNVEYRERDGTIRAVDHYAIAVDKSRVAIVPHRDNMTPGKEEFQRRVLLAAKTCLSNGVAYIPFPVEVVQ